MMNAIINRARARADMMNAIINRARARADMMNAIVNRARAPVLSMAASADPRRAAVARRYAGEHPTIGVVTFSNGDARGANPLIRLSNRPIRPTSPLITPCRGRPRMINDLHVLNDGRHIATFPFSAGTHLLGTSGHADLLLVTDRVTSDVCDVEVSDDGDVSLEALPNIALRRHDGEKVAELPMGNGTFAEAAGVRLTLLRLQEETRGTARTYDQS
jgi:hypothetical protein